MVNFFNFFAGVIDFDFLEAAAELRHFQKIEMYIKMVPFGRCCGLVPL